MKVILKGKPSVQWFLDGQQICGGASRDLTPKQVKEAESSNLIEKYIDEKKVTKTKVYTEKEFYSWNKDKQVKELKKLGLEPGKIESARVKQLLEAQK